jgi:hypothetical protein
VSGFGVAPKRTFLLLGKHNESSRNRDGFAGHTRGVRYPESSIGALGIGVALRGLRARFCFAAGDRVGVGLNVGFDSVELTGCGCLSR